MRPRPQDNTKMTPYKNKHIRFFWLFPPAEREATTALQLGPTFSNINVSHISTFLRFLLFLRNKRQRDVMERSNPVTRIYLARRLLKIRTQFHFVCFCLFILYFFFFLFPWRWRCNQNICCALHFERSLWVKQAADSSIYLSIYRFIYLFLYFNGATLSNQPTSKNAALTWA